VSLSVFAEEARPPDAAALAAALGGAAPLWAELAAQIEAAHPPIERRWNFAGAKFGWSLRLVRRDRIVLYLIPQADGFLAGVVLGERAAAAARDAGLPETVLALLDAAPRYAEGRGIRVPVAGPAEVAAVGKLAALKLSS